MTAFVGIIVVTFGLFHLIVPDVTWIWTEWSHKIVGRVARRTETWDTWRVIYGGIALTGGIIMMFSHLPR